MIKGILLSIFASVFIVSLLFFSFSATGILQENLVTGNIIGLRGIGDYSLIFLIVSFIACFFTIKSIKN